MKRYSVAGRLAAEHSPNAQLALESHESNKAGGLLGRWAEPVLHFRREVVDALLVVCACEAFVQREPHADIGHVVVGKKCLDIQRELGVDSRYGVVGFVAGAKFAHRVLEHCAEDLESNLRDISALLRAEKVSGAADLEIKRGDLEARAKFRVF